MSLSAVRFRFVLALSALVPLGWPGPSPLPLARRRWRRPGARLLRRESRRAQLSPPRSPRRGEAERPRRRRRGRRGAARVARRGRFRRPPFERTGRQRRGSGTDRGVRHLPRHAADLLREAPSRRDDCRVGAGGPVEGAEARRHAEGLRRRARDRRRVGRRAVGRRRRRPHRFDRRDAGSEDRRQGDRHVCEGCSRPGQRDHEPDEKGREGRARRQGLHQRRELRDAHFQPQNCDRPRRLRPRREKPAKAEAGGSRLSAYPALPEPISSFGAAVCDGYLYVYSGHIGGEHEHSQRQPVAEVSPHQARRRQRVGRAAHGNAAAGPAAGRPRRQALPRRRTECQKRRRRR